MSVYRLAAPSASYCNTQVASVSVVRSPVWLKAPVALVKSDACPVDRITPDEFLTVSTAPLTVPPEYGLRPPAPGQPRPQELAPESAARQILLGQRQAVTRSEGEQQLVTLAGGDRAGEQRGAHADGVGDVAQQSAHDAARPHEQGHDDAEEHPDADVDHALLDCRQVRGPGDEREGDDDEEHGHALADRGGFPGRTAPEGVT